MKGIILKDLYENFYIKKNLASYIFGALFIGLAMIFINTNYAFILYTMFLSIIFGSTPLEASSEQDEKANFGKLQITFPLTKAEIILSKYLLSLICTGISLLISLIYALANVYFWRLVTLREALTVWGLSICGSLVFTSVVYVCYFLLGKKIGTFIYVAAAIILAGLYGSSTVLFGIESYTSMDTAVRLWFLLPASAVIFVLSCLVSIQIYKRKYS